MQCVWEGDALALFVLSVAGSNECALELHTAASLARETTCGAHGVRLVRLLPAPATASSPIPASAYRATLVVFAVR